MLNRRDKTAGDYAMIGVAPMLVFLMLSSLASFLMMVIYRGGHPTRVSWIMLMFTMGSVGIARIAIEKDRSYSFAYAAILGVASFMAMMKFVDSLVATVLLLGTIAFLADWVIRDCTLIDESADSSDRGLIDSQTWFSRRRAVGDSETASTRRGGQPGRSVLYLALAALPLYGIGQFFLRPDAVTWDRAQKLLLFYLFAALALLVTTSFLGLRRYLRQRGADMPKQVAISWVGGGLAIIAVILLVAFLIPLPGKALASLELPHFLDSPDDSTASQQGWGDDGADNAGENAAATRNDPSGKEKEIGSVAPEEDTEAGDVGDGDRQDGPAGKKEGGQKEQGEKTVEKQSGDQESPQENQSEKQGDGPSSPGEQGSESKQEDSQAMPPDEGESQEQGAESKDPAKSGDPKSEQDENRSSEDSSSPSDEMEAGETEPGDPETGPEQQASQANLDGPSAFQKMAESLPAASALLQTVIFLVLAGVVGFFLYVNRHAFADFWRQLMGGSDDRPDESTLDEFLEQEHAAPPRAFSSFTQPTSSERDPRRVMVVSFAAWDAWCREAGMPRGKGETPSEFLIRVQRLHPEMSESASRVVAAYNRIVYGRGGASDNDLRHSDQLWAWLHKNAPQPRHAKPVAVHSKQSNG